MEFGIRSFEQAKAFDIDDFAGAVAFVSSCDAGVARVSSIDGIVDKIAFDFDMIANAGIPDGFSNSVA